MTTIIYSIVGKYGEVRDFKPSNSKQLKIKILGSDGGFLSLGEITYPLVGDSCTVDLSHLDDGTYTPIYTKEKTYTLETVSKIGNRIIPEKTSDETIRRLLARAELIETKVKHLEEALDALELLIKGTTIF